LLLATITVRSATLTASAPSGWTLRIDTAGNNMRQVTLWRFADANDAGTTYSFSLSGAVRATGAISAYSGVDTTTPTTPIDASAGSIDAVSGTSATPPQVPTTFLRAAVVVATSWTTSGTTVGEGTGTTERYESASANNSTLEAADYIQGAPGASTPPA